MKDETSATAGAEPDLAEQERAEKAAAYQQALKKIMARRAMQREREEAADGPTLSDQIDSAYKAAQEVETPFDYLALSLHVRALEHQRRARYPEAYKDLQPAPLPTYTGPSARAVQKILRLLTQPKP